MELLNFNLIFQQPSVYYLRAIKRDCNAGINSSASLTDGLLSEDLENIASFSCSSSFYALASWPWLIVENDPRF